MSVNPRAGSGFQNRQLAMSTQRTRTSNNTRNSAPLSLPPPERYDGAVNRDVLAWQSKLILLLVLPVVGCGLVLETSDWLAIVPGVVYWTFGLSASLGILTYLLRAATPFAALTGAIITAQLIYATSNPPYDAFRTYMIPVLAVSLLAYFATRIGRAKKEKLGTAEARRGRSAAQVAANLGAAALISTSLFQSLAANTRWLPHSSAALLVAALAAMAEAAADTVSSEIGQVFGGRPRMITTLRPVATGTDGGITLAGSIAGIAAAAIVSGLGAFAVHADIRFCLTATAGAVFGLFFDSLLGATLERRGWLNNDAVNFISTVSAAGCALALAAFS